MGATAKTDAAVESALIALGMSEQEAEFALRDMLIEEVSYVDRAANKRKFLVVKSAGGSMADTVTKDDGEGGGVILQSAVKEGLLRVLTESLERLVSAVEMVRGAEEVMEAEGPMLPEAVSMEIGGIADLLGGALSQYASPMPTEATIEGGQSESLKAVGSVLAGAVNEAGEVDAAVVAEAIKQLGELLPATTQAEAASDDATVTAQSKADEVVSRVLAQAGEIAATLSEKAGHEDELSAETMAGVRQLAAMLNEIVARYPEPQAKADDSAEAEDVEKAGRKMSAARLDKLKSAVDALSKLIADLEGEREARKRLAQESAQPDPERGPYGSVGTGGSEDDTQAGPAQGEDVEGLEAVMKRLASLTKQVTELKNEPDAPASRTEPEPSPVSKKETSRTSGAPRQNRRGGPWVW